VGRKGLVAIFFKAVQAGRGRSPALVKQNGLPPMRQGLKRKSFLPPGGKKIAAESPVFGAGAPKRRQDSESE
jgi:hypothetical protein